MAETKIKSADPALIASLAHFSAAAWLFAGPLAMIAPLLIWLIQREKENPNQLIIFHGRQAFVYQLVCLIAGGVLGMLAAALSAIFIGIILIPVLVLAGLAAFAYGIYGGVQVYQGKNFRYIYIADFLEAGEKSK